jgi:branched-chain amino acid transport system permease protein
MEAALTMGINSEKMFRIAFGLGCGVAGLAGLLFLPYFYCTPTVGHTFTTKAFIIVVLGGMGDINGALLGGIIIGIIETIGTLYLETSTVNMIVFAIFILFLIFRPTGLLGKKEA